MGKIFDAYAKRRGVDTKALRFMLDGKRILPTDTPTILELEDRDQIDCLLEQIGGWGVRKSCKVVKVPSIYLTYLI